MHFESVTVYYFNRRQGFTSVPTQGGSTLGMSPRHTGVKRFTLREFAMEQKRSHRNMLKDHLKEEKLNAIKLKVSVASVTVPAVRVYKLQRLEARSLLICRAKNTILYILPVRYAEVVNI